MLHASRLAPLVLLLCVSVACSGEERRFAETTSLWPTWQPGAGFAPAGHQLRDDLMTREITDAVLLLRHDETVRFAGLRLPGQTEVSFGFVTAQPTATLGREPDLEIEISPENRGSNERLAGWRLAYPTTDVEIEALSTDGKFLWRGRRRLDPVPMTPGHTAPARVRIEAEGEDEIGEIRLRFERPDGKPGGGVIALVRPRAHFEQRLPPRPTTRPRQVLLITTDTLRADHLGCYGHATIQTPHIDALAADGALFRRAYTATNVTNPSHSSIFSSLYARDHGVTDNFHRMQRTVPTLIEGLAQQGLRTAAFVSAFNFQPGRSDLGERFDEFRGPLDFYERRAEDVNDDLLPWLTAHADDEFFVWAHYFDAHMPYTPPPPWDDLYAPVDGRPIQRPLDYSGNASWYEPDQLGDYLRRYMGEVSYLDHELGRVFERLRALGRYSEAMIILVSDHGESLGEHGIYCEHAGLYEATVRVPLIIKPPGAAGGRVVEALVSTLDVYPTLFDYLGLPIDHPTRGRSLRPLVSARADSESSDGARTLFSEHARLKQLALLDQGGRQILDLSDDRVFPNFDFELGKLERFGPLGEVMGKDAITRIRDEVDLDPRMLEFMRTAGLHVALPSRDSAEAIAKLRALGYVEDEVIDTALEHPYEDALRRLGAASGQSDRPAAASSAVE